MVKWFNGKMVKYCTSINHCNVDNYSTDRQFFTRKGNNKSGLTICLYLNLLQTLPFYADLVDFLRRGVDYWNKVTPSNRVNAYFLVLIFYFSEGLFL